MAAIDTLLEQIADASLRERLRVEINRLTQNKKFGLVFEEHMPECTLLYGVPVKRGGTVAKKANKISETYTVIKVNKDTALCRSKVSGETEEITKEELVTVSEFGEAIFPCLMPIDRVENAPDSDLWHTRSLRRTTTMPYSFWSTFMPARWTASISIRPTTQELTNGNTMTHLSMHQITGRTASGCLL